MTRRGESPLTWRKGWLGGNFVDLLLFTVIVAFYKTLVEWVGEL